ncbi:MAG: guanylate kinase [Burkholderiales bacterium]
MKGLLFVVTAPSGAGKTSLINAVLAEESRLRLSVSYTTRPPRPAEKNGREYHFVDDDSFVAMLERGEFLESAQVHGHRYGTSQATITGALEGGYDLVLEIDWQGAQQVRRLLPECVGIFLLPPSLGELERRLRTRGQDSDQVIARRMAAARDEIAHVPESDYVIINKDFDIAKRDLLAIIRAERLVTERQLSRIGELF